MCELDVARRKYLLLKEATEVLNKENGDCWAELKASAFETLLHNPGSEFGDWKQALIGNYATEVVEAYGCNPEDVEASLSDLWETPYKDASSGLEYYFSTWAEAFCNEASVQMYYDMIEKLKNGRAIGSGVDGQ